MAEPDEALAEALPDRAVFDLVLLQMLLPERQRAFGHRVDDRLHLARTTFSGAILVGERGHDRARLDIGVRIIEMIVRGLAVHQDGLLGQALADDTGEKVDVLLCARGTSSDVVISGGYVVHEGLLWKYLNQLLAGDARRAAAENSDV